MHIKYGEKIYFYEVKKFNWSYTCVINNSSNNFYDGELRDMAYFRTDVKILIYCA